MRIDSTSSCMRRSSTFAKSAARMSAAPAITSEVMRILPCIVFIISARSVSCSRRYTAPTVAP